MSNCVEVYSLIWYNVGIDHVFAKCVPYWDCGNNDKTRTSVLAWSACACAGLEVSGGKCNPHLRFGGLSIYITTNFTVLSIAKELHFVNINISIYWQSAISTKMRLKGCSPNLDFCALCPRETCPKKAIEDFEWQSPIHFLLCCCYHRGCPYLPTVHHRHSQSHSQ